MSISRARRSGISASTYPRKSRSLQDSSGLPGIVQSLTATQTGNTTASASWSAPVNSGDSAITSYTVGGGGSASVSGTTATITGLTPGTAYNFTITPVNAVGPGKSGNAPGLTTTNVNAASGGTEATIPNFNGTGQTWKTHTFTSPGTLTVSQSGTNAYRLLVVGGGGGGSNRVDSDGAHFHGGNRGGGGEVLDVTNNLPVGTYPVTVGSGGANMAAGTNSTIHTYTGRRGLAGNGGAFPSIGGASGNGNPGGTSPTYTAGGGGAGGAGVATSNGPGVASNISGSSVTYGAGGSGSNGPKGGGGFGGSTPVGTGGAPGVVIVAYQV